MAEAGESVAPKVVCPLFARQHRSRAGLERCELHIGNLAADLDNGSTIYDNACAACHGETGQGGQGLAPLNDTSLTSDQVMLVIDGGRSTMPAFDVFSDQELLDIGTFVKDKL